MIGRIGVLPPHMPRCIHSPKLVPRWSLRRQVPEIANSILHDVLDVAKWLIRSIEVAKVLIRSIEMVL
jgi:hypothetical protein